MSTAGVLVVVGSFLAYALVMYAITRLLRRGKQLEVEARAGYQPSPPATPDSMESAADEFCRAMFESPAQPVVHDVSTEQDVANGVFRAVVSVPKAPEPKPRMNGMRILSESALVPVLDMSGMVGLCPSCGRRPPKHRHSCTSRSRRPS